MLHWKTFGEIHLGPLTLHTFGLCVALGVLLASEVVARRNIGFGVSREETQRIVLWLVSAGLIGARLTWVVSNFSRIESPLDVIAVWKGGMQFSGGFLCALAIVPWVTRGLKPIADRRNLLDSAMLGLAVGQLIGRIGCISVGEHLGNPTSFFLGWTYDGGETREGPLTVGLRYHNAALYEALWLIPIILVLMRRARAPRYPGQVSIWLMGSYGVLRFLTDTLRAYDQRLWGLTGAQFMCIGLIIATPVLARRWRRASQAAPAGVGGIGADSGAAAGAAGVGSDVDAALGVEAGTESRVEGAAGTHAAGPDGEPAKEPPAL